MPITASNEKKSTTKPAATKVAVKETKPAVTAAAKPTPKPAKKAVKKVKPKAKPVKKVAPKKEKVTPAAKNPVKETAKTKLTPSPLVVEAKPEPTTAKPPVFKSTIKPAEVKPVKEPLKKISFGSLMASIPPVIPDRQVKAPLLKDDSKGGVKGKMMSFADLFRN